MDNSHELTMAFSGWLAQFGPVLLPLALAPLLAAVVVQRRRQAAAAAHPRRRGRRSA